MLSRFSHVGLFATPWTVALQVPVSRDSPGNYWSGLPFPSPGDLPNPGLEPTSIMNPALAGRRFTTAPPGNPNKHLYTPRLYPPNISCAPRQLMRPPHSLSTLNHDHNNYNNKGPPLGAQGWGESPRQCRRPEFNLWSAKIPHAAE